MTGQAITTSPSGAHLRAALLPWESTGAFEHLADQWRAAYCPQGPAEAALVNQLIWIDWRRRRICLGERALHMAQLHARTGSTTEYGASDGLVKRALVDQSYRLRKYGSRSVVATTARDDADLADYAQETSVRITKMLTILDETGDYAGALSYLEEDIAEWWEETCGEEKRFTEDCDGLRAFLTIKLEPWLSALKLEAQERGAVRLQAQGESLDPARMGILLALEERLTRQFEKALGMLIKLQALRVEPVNDHTAEVWPRVLAHIWHTFLRKT